MERINDDKTLLKQLVKISKSRDPLFNPGPYWAKKSKNAIDEIHRVGIENFRNYKNGCAISYADTPLLDPRNQMGTNFVRRLLKSLLYSKIFELIFSKFVNISLNNFNLFLKNKNFIRNNSDRVDHLFSILEDVETLIGSPNDTITNSKSGQIFSNHYLDLLDSQLRFDDFIDFSRIKRLFEIGGGFGANVHLFHERFPNLNKFIYLDISPNLYVAIQYFRTIYGNVAVKDPTQFLDSQSIEFSDDENLEIFCILPEQVKLLKSSIDVFWNAHSFVEMTEDIVKNYFKYIQNLSLKGELSVCLTTYDEFNLETTIDPDKLPSILGVNLDKYIFPSLEPGRVNIFFHGKI